jgi:protein disulfide-isomerase A1
LVPEYESAATALKGEASVAKVDCTVERELCERYGVQGFPTLKLFRNDDSTPVEYDQARKSDAMVKFVLKQKSPAFLEFKSEEEMTKATSVATYLIVGFVDPSDQTSRDIFVNEAKTRRNEFDFALVTEKSLLSNIPKLPTVKIFRNFDEPVIEMSGEFTGVNLDDFVNQNSLPLLGVIGPENYQKYVSRNLPLLWLFVDMVANHQEAVLTELGNVAKQFRSNVIFVKLDGVKWAEHAKNFGLTGTAPEAVIEDRVKHKNYLFPKGEFTAPLLQQFVQQFIDGSLQPHLKTQEPPKDNSGPVKVVVGSTFDSIVMDKSKDVFVEFYAPWCGHCKNLAPKYDKLGAEFAKTESVVIAKIDSTENDVPVEVRGFPTLMLFTAADKANPIPYEGDRDVAAMAKFIRSKATTLAKSGGDDDDEDDKAKTKDEL